MSSILRQILDKSIYSGIFAKMKVSERIEKKINGLPDGITFTYRELPIALNEYAAAAKAIERLVKKSVISRVSAGIFYKPRQTAFGNLRPREEELLKPYLFYEGNRVAYITGIALYNRMGLTTQVPKDIRVASRNKRIITKLGSIQVKPVKSYADVTENNYYLMELLDVLKDFKTIPDTEMGEVIKHMLQKFRGLSAREKDKLVEVSLKYPPRVRALTGALLNELNPVKPVIELKKSINPFSFFKYGIDRDLLQYIDYWNIR